MDFCCEKFKDVFYKTGYFINTLQNNIQKSYAIKVGVSVVGDDMYVAVDFCPFCGAKL